MANKQPPRGPKQPPPEPFRVNWLVIGGIVIVVGLAAFLSLGQSDNEPAASSDGTAANAGTVLSWDAPPPMTIDTSKSYTATLTTDAGDIVVELFDDLAPVTVNNFVFLANQGFYDNTTFHRVISGFMAQGGDPTATGAGGPGYRFEDELDTGLEFDRAGLLAMANSGPNTNGSQFFITYAPTPHLNGLHTIFGEVTEGLDVALALKERDPQAAAGPGSALIAVTIDER
ncbi:MAG: peptidylprolyl isomerase [Anaerolineales bacterium]